MGRSLRYILFPPDWIIREVGPEHAYLHDMGRAEYVPVTDEEAVWAFEYLAKTEGSFRRSNRRMQLLMQ